MYGVICFDPSRTNVARRFSMNRIPPMLYGRGGSGGGRGGRDRNHPRWGEKRNHPPGASPPHAVTLECLVFLSEYFCGISVFEEINYGDFSLSGCCYLPPWEMNQSQYVDIRWIQNSPHPYESSTLFYDEPFHT